MAAVRGAKGVALLKAHGIDGAVWTARASRRCIAHQCPEFSIRSDFAFKADEQFGDELTGSIPLAGNRHAIRDAGAKGGFKGLGDIFPADAPAIAPAAIREVFRMKVRRVRLLLSISSPFSYLNMATR